MYKMFFKNRGIIGAAIVCSLASCNTHPSNTPVSSNTYQGIQKLEFNNPGLLVDLDVGFKSVPMPMDFDGDGDIDLLLSQSGSYVESGIFYYENISGNLDLANRFPRIGSALDMTENFLRYPM